ncbi:mitochondrial 54S ribosomal protein mL54 [Drepanopeziza brunnea f. sp. 'multigermtubi']|nr:hypothetical protein L3040_004641 [Drepanopeziza brunnea f. sp. 'multigermtubi']
MAGSRLSDSPENQSAVLPKIISSSSTLQDSSRLEDKTASQHPVSNYKSSIMICTRCLHRGASSFRSLSSPILLLRQFSLSSTLLSSASPSPPPATSTSAAQPFSTPLTPAPNPVSLGTASKPPAKSKVVIPISSCPAGTTLKGLNFIKDRQDPVALPEEDYPEWLWSVLEKRVGEGEGEEGDGDEFSKSAKLRRKAAKRARKLEALRRASGQAEPEVRVPLTQQSIDLPANEEGTVEGALVAEGKRQELRGAMRRERRKKIKEANFLRGM